MSLSETPSQTVGPFFSIGMTWEEGPFVVPEGTDGAIWLSGRVFDGEGAAVPDAVVETWQADPEFRGFGRSLTDDHGHWRVLTRRPGGVDGHAPHVDVAVFARGLLRQVLTRVYFPEEEDRNAADPVLSGLEREARETLIAEQGGDGYRFDIHLQGPNATQFFRL
jgi:protocatechuate 3,4-dioxygenase, alpha subunit